MSYSKSHQYYEPRSRSRSRDDRSRYRREYREEGDRYASSYGGGGGGGSSHYPASTSSSGYGGSRPARAPRPYGVGGAGGNPDSKHSPPGGSRVVAVFNLSIYTTEAELYDIFVKFGPLKKATVVLDAKTGRSRGFGFVYFESIEDARVAHVQANGIEIGDRRIRVDYSATDKPHDPTPGVYYGKVSHPKREHGGGGGHYERGGGGHGPPLGPPASRSAAPVGGGGGGAAAAAAGGYYHCRACEIEAMERERWEREARRYGNGSDQYHQQYYYQDKYAAPAPPEPRGRERSSVMSRSRSDYYRGGAVR
uniref:Putative translation initiation factor 3 subunit g eif-3g n=1 Tax=Culex tarsalis TaxID=7177 RepID=A0A1Q3G1D6_CULTA